MYKGSGFILLQIASARITRSTERNLSKVRLQTSLAFASLAVALLHLQKDFGRVKYSKRFRPDGCFHSTCLTWLLERKTSSHGGMSGTSAKHLGKETNYGAHHLLRGLPIHCFCKESLSAHGTVPRLHCSLATQTQDTNMGKSATTFHSRGSPLRPFPRVLLCPLNISKITIVHWL